MRTTDTIIIGGGIAGLACARELSKSKLDFILITKTVGGKITSSPNGRVNYGAYLLPKDNRNIRRFARLTRRISPFQARFHSEAGDYSFWRSARHTIQLGRMLWACLVFRRDYLKFRSEAATLGQAEALKLHPALSRLYQTPAAEWIKANNVEKIVKLIFEPGVYMCTFLSVDELTAFDLLHLCAYAFFPVYEFSFSLDDFIKPLKERVILDEVESISPGENITITTLSGQSWQAKQVVLATPADVTARLIKLPAIRGASRAHMFHIAGRLKPEYTRHVLHLYPAGNDTIFFSRQLDGTVLLYSRESEPDLKRLFEDYKIITHINWNPAMYLRGSVIIDRQPWPNLQVIGDHNVAGLEDAYSTGLYAASQISSVLNNN